MKLFECQHCGQPLYFENTRCESCRHRIGYLPEAATMTALAPAGALWAPLVAHSSETKFCANAEDAACNWLLSTEDENPFCLCCRHNRTIPDLSAQNRLRHWRQLEQAKHRLFYSLLRFRLPLATRREHPEGLAFDFLADPDTTDPNAPKVMTGHDAGLITLSLAEADDVERERRRSSLGEPYRTLLGHFRHEIAHYYWDRLVRDDPSINRFREIFGDEREDYGEALKRHYGRERVDDWQSSFVTPYAGSHPWEDFAETWAHYFHIVDTLETAQCFGLRVRPQIRRGRELAAEIDFDPYRRGEFEPLIKAWLPLTFAVNSLNRSMGIADLYPFVLCPKVIEKLAFIHGRIHGLVEGSARANAGMERAIDAGQRNKLEPSDA